MRPVNLLPKDDPRFERRKPPNLVVLLGVAAAIVISAILAAWYLSASAAATGKKAALDAAHAELAALPAPQTRPEAETTLAAEKSQRIAVLSSTLATRVAWDRVLREVSLVLPDDVWLTTLSANAPGISAAGGTATAGGFSITGYTYSHDGVARLLSRLSVIPYLQAVALQKSVVAEERGRLLAQFTISAVVRGPGASS